MSFFGGRWVADDPRSCPLMGMTKEFVFSGRILCLSYLCNLMGHVFKAAEESEVEGGRQNQ
ncbi:hypothetical protein POX_b02456 [Penicillium oxalicum]|uniref:hypothetical protein n=1 Tax=Penicillium oxalicum TaxID=69781 RepID=UPI0020B7085E|nr:hypothetical protein POX_b02456 [Penicillium oxalicum]KAI2792418.1 hypothetical protein POX_b02456 [Penicillium oxalicum]